MFLNVQACDIELEDKASMDVLPLRDTQLHDAHTPKYYAPVCCLIEFQQSWFLT